MLPQRFRAIGLLLVALSVWSAGRVGAQQAKPRPAPRAERALEKALLEAHNRERAREDKPALELDPRLTEAATAHSRDMAEQEQMSHEGSDGSTSSERVRRAGYKFLREGENVAAGQTHVDELMAAWMDSSGHRANILGDFTQMGAARVRGKDGRFYWTVCLGTPFPKLDPATAPRAVLQAINERRSAADEPPLAESDVLGKVAQAAAEELAERADKALPNQGRDVFEKVRDSGFSYSAIRSSVSGGQFTPAELLDALKGRKDDGTETSAVLGPYTDIGIGLALDDDGVPTWVLLLATKQEPTP
jgi:uncharacterized protein YkwD